MDKEFEYGEEEISVPGVVLPGDKLRLSNTADAMRELSKAGRAWYIRPVMFGLIHIIIQSGYPTDTDSNSLPECITASGIVGFLLPG